MSDYRCLILAAASLIPFATSAATFERDAGDPLHFFDGNTETVSTTKIIAQKSFVSHSLGMGRIGKDGELELVQHVNEQGRPEFDRFWRIRRIASGRFEGTMSEATGPVTIEKRGSNYLFRFRLKDDLAVEEWLVPQSDTTVSMLVIIRKYGITVAHSKGWIRRLG